MYNVYIIVCTKWIIGSVPLQLESEIVFNVIIFISGAIIQHLGTEQTNEKYFPVCFTVLIKHSHFLELLPCA